MQRRNEAAAPAPTSPPRRREVMRAFARQAQVETCGWVSNNPDAPVTCDAGLQCARDDTNELFGCCDNASGCQYHVTCIGSSYIGRITDTDTTLYCSESTAPACNYFRDEMDFTSFFCGSTEDSFHIGSMATNQNGVAISTGYSYSFFTQPTSTSSQHLPPPKTHAASGPTATGTNSAQGASGNGTSSSNSASSSSGGTNSGAIVGIAVACVILGLAIISVVGFCVWKQKQKQKNQAAARPFISQPQLNNQYPGAGAGPVPSSGSMTVISGKGGYSQSDIGSVHPSSIHPASVHQSGIYPGGNHPQNAATGQYQPSGQYPPVPGSSQLNNQNLNQHLARNEWSAMHQHIPQRQTANIYAEEDGLGHLPELRPQDAADEPRYHERFSYQPSNAALTAMHPASEMVWHRPV